MLRICLFALSATLLFASCAPKLTTFDQELYESQNWTENDLKRIQFYLSEDLTIYRYLDEESSTSISDGQIKIVDGRKTEQIYFPQGTPGVFLFMPKEENFAISFEKKSNTHYLTFGPNSRYGGQYMLLASEWESKTGKITYAGKRFYTSSEEIPKLMVDLKKENRNSTQSRTAGGRTVKGK